MKKIFIVGSGPLPNEKEGIRDAAGLRTEQFFRPLKSQGHDIILICITNQKPSEPEENQDGTIIHRICRHDKNLHKKIKALYLTFEPSVAIGINTYPAFVLSKVVSKDTPFWADLNGWIMAEAQARSFYEKNNSLFANAWRQEKNILLRADKISTVSTAQKFATIGELASIGMIKGENFLSEKVFAIPNATKFFTIDVAKKNDNTQSLFRGKKIPNDAFVVSWIGGYNNWVDEQVLFDAVEDAMEKVDNLYFVSTGGKIKNIAGSPFDRFFQRIEKSRHKDRFIFLGWIKTSEMRKIYQESNVGINVDFACIETWTGARNRINEMLKFGLPIITTAGSEISQYINQYKAGIQVENGNVMELSSAITTMARSSKDEIDTYKKNALNLSAQVFNEVKLTKPLQDFVKTPNREKTSSLKINSILFYLENIIWYYKKNSIKIFLAKIWQKIL